MVGQNRKLKWSLDDLDLTQPIEPLSRLINEPEKLIDEVFKIAAQYLPKDIVPASLKDIPTVELKKLCLEQLKKVEHQTLLNILSNESDDPTDLTQTHLADFKDGEKTTLNVDQVKTKEAKDVEIQVEMNCIPSESEVAHCSKADEKSTKSESKGIPSETASTSNETTNLDSILDQAEMEIRELELRAQAIRELLKKHEEADNAIKATESQKDSRKRQKIDSSLSHETKNTSKIETKTDSAKAVNLRKGEKSKESKVTSRLTRNPVSMIEEDETGEEQRDESNGESNELGRKVKQRRSLDESAKETNIMMQVNNDSDDSIDRELKGE